MRKEFEMKKQILLALGWLCFALGMIGVVVPVLPTTPFLLLAAAIFARNSKKCEAWLVSTEVYKRYCLPFKSQGGLTLKKKAEILFIVYSILLISGMLVSHIHVRIFLVVLACIKLFVMIRIPTLKKGENVS